MSTLNHNEQPSRKARYESFTANKDALTILGVTAVGALVAVGIATNGTGLESPRQTEYQPTDFSICAVETVGQGDTVSDLVEDAARTIHNQSDMYLGFNADKALGAIQHPDSSVPDMKEGTIQPNEEYNICLTSDGKAVSVTPVK